MNTELLTIPEFCQMANTGRTNAYKLINSGALKAVKLGKKTLIRKADMDTWVSSLNPYKPVQAAGEAQ